MCNRVWVKSKMRKIRKIDVVRESRKLRWEKKKEKEKRKTCMGEREILRWEKKEIDMGEREEIN